jgi:multidrug transporter EmrE-like cation transporter
MTALNNINQSILVKYVARKDKLKCWHLVVTMIILHFTFIANSIDKI